MDPREVAADVSEVLLEKACDELLAVGWYSDSRDPRTGTEFISEAFDEHDESGRGVLESAMLESLGQGSYESIHQEDLMMTIRHYESVIDIDVHLSRFKGIVVAVRPTDDHHLDDIIEMIEAGCTGAIVLSGGQ